MSLQGVGAAGLTVVGASAGTGKTHRLAKEVEGAVAGGGACVRIDGLVAVTYTKKAHVELESRIRRALLGSRLPDRAAQLARAYIGTVHGVCLRIVRELAFDAGLSPEAEVLADDTLALRQAIEEAVPAGVRAELDELGERLLPNLKPIEGHFDWSAPIEDIVALARGGRIAPDELPAMAERSWRSLLALDLFHPPAAEGASLDDALASEVERALDAMVPPLDDTAKTRAAVQALNEFRRTTRTGRATWAQWVGLAKLDAGASSREALGGVHAAAEAWPRHPLLRHDLRRFTELVFQAAGVTLDHYDRWKRERRLLDYVDMVEHALRLLETEEIAADLEKKIDLVVVDELQDSSPIQLALFLRLHGISGRSTWVGDPKQCIFEYAGADPRLMDSVLRWAKRSGAALEQQQRNHRSRRALVEVCNAVFAGAFESHSMDAAEVVVTSTRTSDEEAALQRLPALGLFYLEGGKQSDLAEALASGVARLLSGAATPVLDRSTREARSVRGGDVAVLVATNREGAQIASALAARGVLVSLARPGLMETPEGVVIGAALRYLLDERDSLALAELEALQGWNGSDADTWLSRKLEQLEGAAPPPAEATWARELAALRERTVVLSPREIVEGAIIALDLPTLAARWPNAQQRLANIDALRQFAGVYETRCTEHGEGSSLAGLLRFLDGLKRSVYRHGEERRADEQHCAQNDDSVTVTTYHRAKGLEWPVVVLASLDREPRPAIFEVAPHSDAPELDPGQPLAGRWIRYWPWPFALGGAAALEDAAARSPIGKIELERERRERARLLYVGFTRARDHLILAVRLHKDAPRCRWLDELTHGAGPAIVLPPPDAPEPMIDVGAERRRFPARVWRLASGAEAPKASHHPRRWFSRVPCPPVPAYWIRPSAAGSEETEGALPRVAAVHTLREPLVRENRDPVEWGRVGDAVHAFFAADGEGLDLERRREIAARLLAGHGVDAWYSPESLIGVSDAFSAFVRERLPHARWAREIPVEARIDSAFGERMISGRMDLVLETDAELVIVDHKSFPAVGERVWRARSSELLPQLATYAKALRRASPEKRISAWLHYATAGGIVMFEPFQEKTAES